MIQKVKRSRAGFGVNALVWKEAGLFVAKAVEVEVASQGKTQKQAIDSLKEALELYFEDEKIPAKTITPLPSLELHKLFPNFRYA